MNTKDLYQALILDHSRSKKHRGSCSPCTHSQDGYNPMCGDQVTMTLTVSDGKITNIKFDGHGCAISMASASLLCDAVKGKTVDEAMAVFEHMHLAFTSDQDIDESYGKLTALSNVKEFPMRVKCATLAWHTLHAALTETKDEVTTE